MATAYMRPIVAVASSNYSGYPASLAIDGVTTGQSHWISINKSGLQWIYFDLGQQKGIDGLRVYVLAQYIPTIFDVQVSSDAVEWTTVLADFTISIGDAWVEQSFDIVNGRYVRYLMKSSGSNYYLITETQIKAGEPMSMEYKDIGTYITPPIDLATIYENLRIRWESDLSSETSVFIEYAVSDIVPNSTWTAISNGDILSIPQTYGYFLWLKYTLSTSDTKVTPILKKVWLESAESPQDIILVTMKPLKRFPTVKGDLTVSYDASKGNLSGAGGTLKSFTTTFTPTDLIPEHNPGINETITVVPSIELVITPITYMDLFHRETDLLTSSPVNVTVLPEYFYTDEKAWLETSTQLVKFNASGQLMTESQTINMAAIVKTGSKPVFTYKTIIDSVEYSSYISIGADPKQITVNVANIVANHPSFTQATIKMTMTDGALVINDYITIYKIQDEATNTVAVLNNEYHTVVAKYNTQQVETELKLNQAFCDIKIYQGFTDITNQYTFAKTDGFGIKSVFYENKNKLHIVGMTEDVGQVEIVGTHSTLPTVTKSMQLVKSKRGLIINP